MNVHYLVDSMSISIIFDKFKLLLLEYLEIEICISDSLNMNTKEKIIILNLFNNIKNERIWNKKFSDLINCKVYLTLLNFVTIKIQ